MAWDPRGDFCPHCGEHVGMLAQLREENESLKDRIGQLEVAKKRLKSQGDRQLTNRPHYAEGVEVLEYWRDRCAPGAKQVTCGPRMKAVLARLTGSDAYTVDELKRAVDGYAAFPYMVPGDGEWRRPDGRQDQRCCDAELIFRDAKHVEQGFRLASRADMYRQALSEPSEPTPTEPEPVPDLGRIGNAALAYVKGSRFCVFPCLPGNKHPATTRGLLAAKTGDAGAFAVREFWSKNRDANIGLRTGRESGIVVLDVDDGKGGFDTLAELEKEHERLPKTFSVKTPSGGTHYYFQHVGIEIRNATDVPGPGLDIRGDGGYVLAPPSCVAGRPYEIDDELPIAPLPKWLERELVGRQVRNGNGKVDPAAFERIVRAGVAAGARNDQLLRLSGHLWSRGLLPGEVLGLVQAVNRVRCRPPLPEREVAHIVDSVRKMRQRSR